MVSRAQVKLGGVGRVPEIVFPPAEMLKIFFLKVVIKPLAVWFENRVITEAEKLSLYQCEIQFACIFFFTALRNLFVSEQYIEIQLFSKCLSWDDVESSICGGFRGSIEMWLWTDRVIPFNSKWYKILDTCCLNLNSRQFTWTAS